MEVFESAGWDICAVVSLMIPISSILPSEVRIFQVGVYPSVRTTLLLADAAAIKVSCSGKLLLSFKGHYDNLATQEVTSLRALYIKPLDDYKALSFYGPNIVVSEHEEWKKYKKIAAPAFSEVSPLHLC